eukprot:Nk52_evm1s1882 gene=Nk52_evmTU1s1882
MTEFLGKENQQEDEDNEVEAVALSNWLNSMSMLDINQNLEDLYRSVAQDTRDSDGLQSYALAGKRMLIPASEKLEEFLKDFKPGQPICRLSANTQLKMLRKLYKPFACQILEPIYFKKHAIDAVKKNPQDSQ